MADASRLASSQYLLDGSFVSGSIATPEGFDGCGPPASVGCSPAQSPGFTPCGEVQSDAGAMCGVGIRAGDGPLCEGSLYGEMFSRSAHLLQVGRVCPGGNSNRGPSWSAIGGRLSNLALAAK